MKITANSFDCSPRYRQMLDVLMADIFGLPFAGWRGPLGWNADYTSYGIEEGGLLLAHSGVYRMELLVHGARRTAYQIGGVATRPERRGQGLSRRLIEHILAERPGATFFLFANESVLDFYPRFGFSPLGERQPVIELERSAPAAPDGVRQLALDDPRVADYLRHPAGVSAILDCANAAALHAFHLRLCGAEDLYEIPALSAMLLARQEGSRLMLDGLWSTAPLTNAAIVPYLALAFPGANRVYFGFNPDWLGAPYTMTDLAEPSGLHVRGDLGVKTEFIFPLLART